MLEKLTYISLVHAWLPLFNILLSMEAFNPDINLSTYTSCVTAKVEISSVCSVVCSESEGSVVYLFTLEAFIKYPEPVISASPNILIPAIELFQNVLDKSYVCSSIEEREIVIFGLFNKNS